MMPAMKLTNEDSENIFERSPTRDVTVQKGATLNSSAK